MSADEPSPEVHVRVTFLGVRAPVTSQRQEVFVVVPHISRADRAAREQAALADDWVVLSIAEVHP